MSRFKEFEIVLKFPDDEVLGKAGRTEFAKAMIDMDEICLFHESFNEAAGVKGTGIETKHGSSTFVTTEYGWFVEYFKLQTIK